MMHISKMIEIKNRKSNEYSISDKYIAGILLIGCEIKSIVNKECDLTGSYILVNKEPVLVGSYVKQYKAHHFTKEFDPNRDRKLLLTKSEINKLRDQVRRGFSIIPLRLFSTTRGKIKIEFGLGKKIKKQDKRETEKLREHNKEIKQYG